MAALERQRRFNPGLGTHVSYPPCFLRLPRKGSPGPVLVGGAPGGSRLEAGTGVTWALQDRGLTRLHNALDDCKIWGEQRAPCSQEKCN